MNDFTIIIVLKQEFREFPWDVLLNSTSIRFVYLLTLRSGLIGIGTPVGDGKTASWGHIYLRVALTFPIPESLLEDVGGNSSILPRS